MKNLFLYTLCFFAGLLSTRAQTPVKWGNIPPDDLTMTVYPEDPSAPAAVLFDYCEVTVGPRIEYTRLVRIKILKKTGLSFATVEIPFRSVDYYNEVTAIGAQTFNINDKGEVVKSKLHDINISEISVDARNKKKVFTLPEVKPGSVIEYRYTIRSLDLVKPGDWYFQSIIPTRYSEYAISIPKRFDYLVSYTKGEALTSAEQQDYASKIQWLYNTKLNQIHRELDPKHNLLWESPNQGTRVFLVNGQTTRFKMKNIPAFKPEKGMDVFADYYPGVKVHLYMAAGNYSFNYRPIMLAAKKDYDSYSLHDLRYGSNYSGYITYWLPTWDEANKGWLKNDNIGMRLIKSFNFKPILDETFKPEDSEIENINRMYNWVKQHIAWNGNLSASAANDLDDVLKKGTGSSGEINLLLVALLQRAGLDASPVLIRTRNLGRAENIYPAKDQFNHLVCNIKTNSDEIYLDAATTQNEGGKIPWYINHASGWLLKKEGFGWIELGDPNKIPIPAEKTQEI